MKTYVPGLAEAKGNDLATSADLSYMTHDHLGSTRGMWDDGPDAVGTWEYTPYGAPFNFAGPPDVTQLYTGHDLDPVTGQYYAPFRYLDPAVGRWMKQDPLGMVDGTNMYQYVGLNPISHLDVLGLEDDKEVGSDPSLWDRCKTALSEIWGFLKDPAKKWATTSAREGRPAPLNTPAKPSPTGLILHTVSGAAKTQTVMPIAVVHGIYNDNHHKTFYDNPEDPLHVEIPSSWGMPGLPGEIDPDD
jgi:RHS repeat-associated protein